MLNKYLPVVLAILVVAMTVASPTVAGDSAGGAGSLLLQENL